MKLDSILDNLLNISRQRLKTLAEYKSISDEQRRSRMDEVQNMIQLLELMNTMFSEQ